MEQKHQSVSQNQKLYNLLKDGFPHSTVEILHIVYNLPDEKGIARISARIYDVQKKYNCEIGGKRDKQNPSIYWYQLKLKPSVVFDKEVYRPEVLARLSVRQMSLI